MSYIKEIVQDQGMTHALDLQAWNCGYCCVSGMNEWLNMGNSDHCQISIFLVRMQNYQACEWVIASKEFRLIASTDRYREWF